MEHQRVHMPSFCTCPRAHVTNSADRCLCAQPSANFRCLNAECYLCYTDMAGQGRQASQSGAVRVVLVNHSDPETGSQGAHEASKCVLSDIVADHKVLQSALTCSVYVADPQHAMLVQHTVPVSARRTLCVSYSKTCCMYVCYDLCPAGISLPAVPGCHQDGALRTWLYQSAVCTGRLACSI